MDGIKYQVGLFCPPLDFSPFMLHFLTTLDSEREKGNDVAATTYPRKLPCCVIHAAASENVQSCFSHVASWERQRWP